MKLNCNLLVIPLLMLVVEIKSNGIFSTGNNFDHDDKVESRAGSSGKEMWYNQTLDHFNSTDKRKWPQLYYVNEQYYDRAAKNSPIFLKLGGESAISSGGVTTGFWVERAIEHGALLLQLEHRFYGKSRPTTDMSTENLQYLSIQQALEDAASYIAAMQQTYKLSKTNRWILFGGSYPGNLVAWFRLKYPNLVYGVVSSSSPVESVVDFKDYFKVVAESLGTYSRSCVTTISEAYKSIDQLSQDKIGQQTLTKKLNLCPPLENSTDFKNDFPQLNIGLANYFSNVVQNNEVTHKENNTIESICKILTNKTSGATSFDRFASLIKVFLYTRNRPCVGYSYHQNVQSLSVTKWEDGDYTKMGRQWFFQTCNEVGNFQTSSNVPHVFGNKFPLEFVIKKCKEVFGSKYTADYIGRKVKQNNVVYHGKDIVNKVDRVVFVQGSIDPWYPLGVTNSTNSRSPAFYINGTSHCADMMSDNVKDLPQLTTTRAIISGFIYTWLNSRI